METREHTFTNRSGKRMPATLRIPDGAARGTVVVLHGLGGWKDQPLIAAVAHAFCEDGYIAVAFNDSNGVASPDGTFFLSTQSSYERDIDDAMEAIHDAAWFTDPFVLVGHSMGGLAALDYAATHEVERLVLLAPAISWKSMWWAQLPLALIWLVRGHQKMLGIDGKRFALSAGWWKDFALFDGMKQAERVIAPTLVISAEYDHTVAKPREHRTLTRRFPHAEHSTISWADHDFDGHEEEVVATIRQWLTSS